MAALFPGRIDLGIGRAPGTDPRTALALRRHLETGLDNFPRDVQELLAYLAPAVPGQAVRAIPGEGSKVPVWILGSSHYGAQLAAALGLPYAFASHFAPDDLDVAAQFRGHGLEAGPVVFGVAVFDGDDGILIHPAPVRIDANARHESDDQRAGDFPADVECGRMQIDAGAVEDSRDGRGRGEDHDHAQVAENDQLQDAFGDRPLRPCLGDHRHHDGR